MKSILFIRQVPFLSHRLVISIALLVITILALSYQLSGSVRIVEFHKENPLIIVLELLPLIFGVMLLFSVDHKFHLGVRNTHDQERQSLITNVSSTVEKIKSGTYNRETDFTGELILDQALRDIYDKFKAEADEERNRGWTNEGVSILRETMGLHTSIKPMCEEIIVRLVKYLNINQGGIFVLNAEKELDLTACYAFERKKYVKKTIGQGEGLVGQCFLERQRIYITDVPDRYVQITSGLGEANPRCILIVPLNLKDHTMGVMELASFKPFKQHELDFVEKAAEALAQSIATIQVTEETQKLLEKSLEREQEMKDQEERMRQNVEELYVTQEEMRKVNVEMEEIFKAIDTLTATVELNKDGEIIKLNDRLLATLGSSAQELYGNAFSSLLRREEGVDVFQLAWTQVLGGESVEKVLQFNHLKGEVKWLRTGLYPLQGKDGIQRIICFLTDITEIKTKELQLDEVNLEMTAFRKMLIRILNEIPLKVFLKQYNGKFFVVNDAVSRFHGFETPEGMIGKSDFDFYDSKDASEWLEAEHKIIAAGKTEYLHEDGGKILRTVKLPFYIDPLKETGLLGYQADVTELEELKRTNKA